MKRCLSPLLPEHQWQLPAPWTHAIRRLLRLFSWIFCRFPHCRSPDSERCWRRFHLHGLCRPNEPNNDVFACLTRAPQRRSQTMAPTAVAFNGKLSMDEQVAPKMPPLFGFETPILNRNSPAKQRGKLLQKSGLRNPTSVHPVAVHVQKLLKEMKVISQRQMFRFQLGFSG